MTPFVPFTPYRCGRAAAAATAPLPRPGRGHPGWLPLAALGATLAGCSSTRLEIPPSPAKPLWTAMVPVTTPGPQQVATDAQGLYDAGQAAARAGQADVALAYFGRAAELRPEWAEARAAYVVALAGAGRVDDAVKVARKGATAVAPPAPPLDAAAAASAAATLPPMVIFPAATTPSSSADTPSAVPAARAPLAPRLILEPMAVTSTPAPREPAPRIEVTPTPAAAPGPRFTWVQKGPQVLQLRLDADGADAGSTAVASATPAAAAAASVAPSKPAPAAPATSTASAPVTAPAAPLAALPGPTLKLALEISNGAGRTGLARGTADRLQTAGVKAPRVTNHVHYNQRTTVLQYRDASHEAAARALAAMLPWKVEVVANPRLGWRTEVRLLLGRDVVAAGAAPDTARPA